MTINIKTFQPNPPEVRNPKTLHPCTLIVDCPGYRRRKHGLGLPAPGLPPDPCSGQPDTNPNATWEDRTTPLPSSLCILPKRNLTKLVRSWRERCGCPKVTPASPPAILPKEEVSRPGCRLIGCRGPSAGRGSRGGGGGGGPTGGSGWPVQQRPHCLDVSLLESAQCLSVGLLENMVQSCRSY
ncbi:hypothetical protein P7K49_038270 [Saguinus oedipus]|uniref:Uncharacterized protein n=1 Tax=Saguinus oedipus TaxID=9490 RepID=A0ABQ9TE81_SAGOE|nr:hypothetical protein P7K49_038270 [Saguinus oedipus]